MTSAARSTIEDVLKRASGPQSAVRELLGESVLWWNCCSEAVRNDPAWLGGRDCEGLRSWLATTASDQERTAAVRADHPVLLARALTIAQEGERDVALSKLLGTWESSGLLSPDAVPGPAQPSGRELSELSPRLAGAVAALLQRCEQLRPAAPPTGEWLAAEGLLAVAALMMTGVAPRKRPVARVPVVFGRSSQAVGASQAAEGATGVLELREFPSGPAGLYPDPRTMGGVRSPNGEFAAALGAAWQLAGPRRDVRCVVWRIVLSDESVPPERIEGPSLGVAFALGLRAVLRRRRSGSWFRDVFYGLRSRTAVTGALDSEGRLLKVAGLDAKLLAVRRKGFRLVVPEANRLEVSAAAPRPGEVRFASTLRDADRFARQFRTGRITVAAIAVAAVTAGAIAVDQRDFAQAQQQSALVSQVSSRADQLRATDPSLAARADIETYRMNPTGDRYVRLIEDANAPLSTVLGTFSGAATRAAFSHDGRTLAALGVDGDKGTLQLWDMKDPAHPVPLGQPYRVPASASLAFSPDGNTLATTDYTITGGVRLWDVKDPAHPRSLGPALPEATSMNPIAFSPDGHILATGAASYVAERLWNVTDPSHPTPLGQPLPHASAVNTIAFSPDSRSLVTSSVTDGARLWNIKDPAHAALVGKIWTGVGAAVFTPDGHTLAIGDDGTVQLLNLSDPTHVVAWGGPLTTYQGDLYTMALSPDGRTLAAPDADQTFRLWNITSPAHPASLGPSLVGQTSRIDSLSFSHDGDSVVTTGNGDPVVHLWHLPAGMLTGHTDTVISTVFAPNGRVLATAAEDSTVRLWNTADPAHPVASSLIKNFNGAVRTMAFSADSHILATIATSDGHLYLWNVTDPSKPVIVARIDFSLNSGDGVDRVAFSPDGRTLATVNGTVDVGDDHSLRLWDISDLAHPRLRGHADDSGVSANGYNFLIGGCVFSPDGRTLVVAGGYSNESVRFWDVTDPEHPVLSGPPLEGGADAMALSPDGRLLATVTKTPDAGTPGDGDVKLWDISNHNHPVSLGPPLSGYTDTLGANPATGIAISPDGRTLATSGSGVRLWNVTDPAHPAVMGSPFGAGTTVLTSVAFSPNGGTLATGGDDTVRLWRMGVDQVIRQICANTDTPTRSKWQQYFSALPYHGACG